MNAQQGVAAGSHTISDAYNLLPFSNNLVTARMSGAQIVQVCTRHALPFTLWA